MTKVLDKLCMRNYFHIFLIIHDQSNQLDTTFLNLHN